MKKLFIAATVVAMTMMSASSFAATNDSNQKKQRDYPSEEMIKELNLTDQQVSDLKAGEATLRDQMKQMREEEKQGNNEAKKEQREKVDKIKQARLALMKKVLNNDQYIKFLEDEYVKANPRMMMLMNGNFQHGGFGGGQGGFGGGGFGGGQGGPQD